MKRFLTVDWDFFIDATIEQRCMLFPDGGNECMPDSLREFIWDSHYRDPRLKEIRVSPDYKFFLKICREFKGPCAIMDSHKYAYNFFMHWSTHDEPIEVYNIDFHHDLYNFKTKEGRVNCGNWVNCLMEDRPNMTYTWVRRPDSDTHTKDIIDYESIDLKEFSKRFGEDIEYGFDALFICRSAIWSPPHLDKSFVKAIKTFMNHSKAKFEIGIDVPRPFEVPSNMDYYKAYAELVDSMNSK